MRFRINDGAGATLVLRIVLPYGPALLVAAFAAYSWHAHDPAGALVGMYLGGAMVFGLAVLRQLRTTMENRRLYARLDAAYVVQGKGLAHRVAELEWLRDASRQVTAARTLNEVLDVTYDSIRAGLGFDRIGINLFDPATGDFEDCVGTDAAGNKIWPKNRLIRLTPESPLWRFPGVAAVLQGEEFYYTAAAYEECPPELRYLFDGTPSHNLMVSLRGGEQVMGMISVDNLLTGRPIVPEDAAPLLALANQVGLAVERARAAEALQHQALHDALTGLPNRSLLHDRLQHALRAAQRNRASLALLLIDLDHFKDVNDTLGHHAGDALLQEVGARLPGVLRAEDTIARLGGDEFAVLLPGADTATAVGIADRLLAALDAPCLVEGQSLEVDASIGIALSPEHGIVGATLLRHADVAMYVAKRAGGGSVLYEAEQDRYSRVRLALASDLRQALAQEQFQLHYQPLVDLETGRLYGVEALLRWCHPTQGFIPPDQFIPLAEQSGVIVPITLWVVEEALRQCAAWQCQGLALGMAINLSMRTLHDPQMPETLAGIVKRYPVAPERLTLEITESSLMIDPTRVLQVLRRLDELGVRIAIDDFGTGYSSLAYLRHLPVDEIKIDKSFMQCIDTDTRDAVLVRSIVAMAHELALAVVAEGVESSEAYALLASLGRLKAQGHYIGRPMPAVEFERWIVGVAWLPAQVQAAMPGIGA